MKSNDLQLSDEESVMNFLHQPTPKIAEALTGILAADHKDLKLSAGKIVQAVLKGSLLTQLGREIRKYQEAGQIKEDYFASLKARASLYELLKFLDEEIPDADLFSALKSIFLSGISKNATEHDECIAYEFLHTARKLTGTEVLILRANHEICLGNVSSQLDRNALDHVRAGNRGAWRRAITQQMGYGDLGDVVIKYEANLETLGLISPRNDMERLSGSFGPSEHMRLTGIGLAFCNYITRYE